MEVRSLRERLNDVSGIYELLSSCDMGFNDIDSASRAAGLGGSGLRHTSGMAQSRTLRVQCAFSYNVVVAGQRCHTMKAERKCNWTESMTKCYTFQYMTSS